MVQAWKQWRYYSLSKETILHTVFLFTTCCNVSRRQCLATKLHRETNSTNLRFNLALEQEGLPQVLQGFNVAHCHGTTTYEAQWPDLGFVV